MKLWNDLSFRQKGFLMVSLHAVLLAIFVFFRLLDADEGLYLSAAREVAGGNHPYFDFAYVHPPYFPYFLAPFAGWGLKSLFISRAISALPSLLLGLGIFFIARRLWNERIAFILWGFWMLNALVLVHHSVAKPVAWADFFVLLTFWFLVETKQRSSFFFSGLWSGMAVNLRGFMLVSTAVFFLFLSFRAEKPRMEKLLFWCFGFVLALAFSLFFFLREPAGFIFNNWTYHYLWGVKVVAAGGRFDFLDRLASLAKFILFPQNTALLLLAGGALAAFFQEQDKRRKEILVLVAALFGGLTTVFFLTTPSLLGYYVQTLPYLLLLAGFGVNRLLEGGKESFSPLFRRGLIAAHLISLALIAYIFLFGQRSRDQQYLLSNVKPVIEYLQKNGTPSDTLFSEWPGYAVLAGMQLPKGTETVGLDIAHLLSAEEKKAYHILDSAGVDSLLRLKKIKWVVTGGTVSEVWPEPLSANYAAVFQAAPITVYRRNE
ncbi:MAG TPA: glycosyltransferase family 39 protein [candidate division Zixibacteria bacterium]|nr:glycosyltransferase family 39 protein [candidate division Zixibacteria bacterium]